MKYLKILKKSKYKLILPTVLDFAFVVFFALAFALSMDRIRTVAVKMMDAAYSAVGQMQEYTLDEVQILKDALPYVKQYYIQIALYFMLFVISVFVIWVIFQSISWYLSSKTLGNKISYKRYLKDFFRISLIYYVLLIIFMTIIIYGSKYLVFISAKFQTPALLTYIISFLFIILFYLAIGNYLSIGRVKKEIKIFSLQYLGRYLLVVFLLSTCLYFVGALDDIWIKAILFFIVLPIIYSFGKLLWMLE